MDVKNEDAKIPANDTTQSAIETPAAMTKPPSAELEATEIGWRIWEFLKTPANFLSILAIIATIIVPAVDKFLKADEALRAKVTELLDTTDKIISIRNEIQQSGDSDTKRALLEARRLDYLSHAFELAKSIQNHVSPPILLVLSGELIEDGSYDEARVFLNDVAGRGSDTQKSEAHLQLAGCFMDKATKGYRLDGKEQNQFQNEMSAALSFYSNTNVDEVRLQRAAILSQWERVAERINDTNRTANLRAEIQSLTSGISMLPSAARQSDALFAFPLNDQALPKSTTYATYKVTSPDEPDRTEALTLFGSLSDLDTNDVLNIYKGGQFRAAWQPARDPLMVSTTNDVALGMRIIWKLVVPVNEGSRPVTYANWIIDIDTTNNFQGTESEISKPPRRITGVILHAP